MTDREALITAIAEHPREDTPRLALADWFDEHGESSRAEFVRLHCEAGRQRPRAAQRAGLLRAAEDLRAEHEADWLGEWSERLVDWDYRRGLLWHVRMTADDFLRHGEELFRKEPVVRLELVTKTGGRSFDRGEPISDAAVREVVAHPTYGRVRGCAVVTGFLENQVDVWLQSLAAATHVTRLRSFGPANHFDLYNEFSTRFGLAAKAISAFCRAPHLRTLRSLELGQCPIRSTSKPDGLVRMIAEAPFARRLQRLNLSQCRLTGIGFRQLATDPVFARLRSLNVEYNATSEPDAWAELFQSRTLTALRSFHLSAERLPEFAGSALAQRVQELSIGGASDEFEADRASVGAAWSKLMAATPPPRRLELHCHNPGRAVFRGMRKLHWLRRVRNLAIKSDSQWDVYGGRTAGLCSLFHAKAMPRLTKLDLHEVGCPAVSQALAQWPGLTHLESLDMSDDYHGRLKPSNFTPANSLTCLRDLQGVIFSTDEDVEKFLALPGLENLTSLQMSFLGHYDRTTYRYTDAVVLTEVAADRVIRSERLSRLTNLTVGFGYTRRIEFHVAPQFADPTVMPRLKTLRIYVSRDGRSDDRPSFEGVRARFGLRLIAW